MSVQDFSLADRFDLSKRHVLLNGTQALVRLMLMQSARDKAAGLNTAGFVTGYRGSPLGSVDLQMMKSKKELTAGNVLFQLGIGLALALQFGLHESHAVHAAAPGPDLVLQHHEQQQQNHGNDAGNRHGAHGMALRSAD